MGNRLTNPKMLQNNPINILQTTHELRIIDPQPAVNKKPQINAREHVNPGRFPRPSPIQHKPASQCQD